MYTLFLFTTPPGKVVRKTNIYPQGVFDVHWNKGLTLTEIAEGVTVEEIQSKTEAPFKVAADLKIMEN